ncbi:hypothetical protein [Alkalilacustris brevis]|uniref:hypothetical protein n=1 Tax=Alkalilacustris brevis TaxID=2026338 RepID=UPI000E0D9BAA|nr:hypothetical protein [Alkalilacustris brevis]
MSDTERLFVQLEARVSDFEKRMRQAERRGTRTYNTLQRNSRTATRRMERDMVRSSTRINTALASTSAAVGNLNTVLRTVGAPLLGAAAFTGLVRGVRGAVSELSELGKTARDVSMDVEELQGVQRGFAREARLSQEQVNASLERFARRVGEAANATGPLNTTVERYGIRLRDANGELRTQGDLLREFSNVIRSASSDQERLAIAQAAFGDTGRRMAQAMNEGAAGIDRMIREAIEAGDVIDRHLIARAEELDDRFNDLARRVSTTFRSMAVEIADFIDRMAQLNVEFDDFLKAREGRTREVAGDDFIDAIGEPSAYEALAAAVGNYDRAINELGNSASGVALDLYDFALNLEHLGEIGAADVLERLGDELSQLVDEFEAGEKSQEDFAEALEGVSGRAEQVLGDLQNVDAQGFDRVMGQVQALRGTLLSATDAAQGLALALNVAADLGPSDAAQRRAGEIQAQTDAQARRKAREELVAFLAEEERLSGRTREQIELERELAQVQRRARTEGIELTDAQAEAQARANLALREASQGGSGREGGGRGGGAGDFTRMVETVQDRTRALEAEAVALVAAAQSGREYGDAINFAMQRARLLNAAQREGLAITPELEAAIDRMADAYARAASEAANAAQEMQEAEARAQRGAQAMTDLFLGIVDGGRSAEQALARLLQQMAQVYLQKALLGLAEGGGPFAFLGGMLGGFAGGGYTGDGTRNQPAGIVHRGEYVFSKAAVQRLGVGRLESMHKAAQGYASGGAVGATAAAGGPQVVVNVKNEFSDAKVEARQRESVDGRAMVDMVVSAVREDYARGGFDGANKTRFGRAPRTVKR